MATRVNPSVQVPSDPFDAILAEVARLRAENEALRARAPQPRSMTLKVSEKGAVSLYGMRRFPVTFYRQEWERILAHADQIKAFINEHSSSLTVKG